MNGRSRFAVAATSAILLAGCSTVRYADQTDTAVVVPDQFAAPASTQAPAPEVCAALPGPQASALLARADANNPDLLAAAARLRSAEALARAAGAGLLPRLDVGVNGSRGTGVFASTSGAGAQAPLTVYQGSVAASYEIDVWRRVRNERDAAVLDAGATAASLDALAITINASAADTWFAWQAQQQLVELLETQRETSKRFLELTRLRFGLGQVPAQDIGRQKQQLLEVERQLEVATSAAAILVTQLEVLAGAAPGALDLVSQRNQAESLPPLPDPGIPATLADARPDVRAARLQLEAADRRTAAAVAQRLPALNLSANLSSIEQSLGDVFSDALWSVGAALAAPVFSGGALAARVESAEAQAQAELAEYAGTLLTALQEVSAALIQNDSQDRIVSNLDLQLEEADKVLQLTRNGYSNGQASYLDVLNALLSKQGLARQRIDATRQQYSNRIALCRALGQPVGRPGAALAVREST